jgi:hypothetical protein
MLNALENQSVRFRQPHEFVFPDCSPRSKLHRLRFQRNACDHLR